MEDVLIATLAAWAKSHPALAAAISAAILLWWALSQGWKALPKERRDEWTASHPRLVGVLRLALELGPDLVGAARVALYQVILGRPARPSNGGEQ